MHIPEACSRPAQQSPAECCSPDSGENTRPSSPPSAPRSRMPDRKRSDRKVDATAHFRCSPVAVPGWLPAETAEVANVPTAISQRPSPLLQSANSQHPPSGTSLPQHAVTPTPTACTSHPSGANPRAYYVGSQTRFLQVRLRVLKKSILRMFKKAWIYPCQ